MIAPPDLPTGITTSKQLPRVGDPGLPNIARAPGESTDPAYVLDVSAGGGLVVQLAGVPAMTTYSAELWVNIAREVDQTIVASRGLRVQIRQQRLHVVIGTTEMRGRRLMANAWYHVAVVVEGQRARLYVNGALVTRASLPAVTDDIIGGAFVVAPSPRGREYAFAGRVDNLRLLSTALTKLERFTVTHKLSTADGVVFAFDFNSGEAPGERVAASSGSFVGQIIPGALIVPETR